MTKRFFKVKVFEVTNEWIDSDQQSMIKTVFHDYTNWEDISEEDLYTLNQWAYKKNQEERYSSDKKFIVITESEFTVPKALKEYVELAKIDQEKQFRAAEKRKKTAEANKLRKKERELERARQILASAQVEDK